MGKQSVNKGLVFLLVFLIGIGIFLFYAKLNFTGFVVIPGGSVGSYDLSEGTFSGTKLDASAVVLDVNQTSGTYTSPWLSVPTTIEVIWSNFAPTSNVPTNATLTYSARTCAETNCTNVSFTAINPGSMNLAGKYFQYKLYMEGVMVVYYNNETNTTTSNLSSPSFSGTNISYSITIPLTVDVGTPSNSTYSNETISVAITSTNASSVWFSIDGGANEIFNGTIQKTLAQGAHSITAYANDTEGHLTSDKVSFSIVFPELYCGDGQCNGVEVCANCPLDCGQCSADQAELYDVSSSSSDSTSIETCTPNWQCDDWSACAEGTQTRTCVDSNVCGLVTGKPAVTQDCVVQETTPVETTTQNKGFFRTVGSVITAPVTFVFANKTRAFIFIGAVLLAVAGFLVFRYVSDSKRFMFNLRNLGIGNVRPFKNLFE